MATINASTTVRVKVAGKKKAAGSTSAIGRIGVGGKKKGAVGGGGGRRGSIAPPLKAGTLTSASAIAELRGFDLEEQKNRVIDLGRRALGEQSLFNKSSKINTPHAASTTRDRSLAAADVAVAAKELGVPFVLLECGIMDQMQKMLFPNGGCVETLLSRNDANKASSGGTLKPSASAVSLVSMDTDDGVPGAIGDATTVTSMTSNGTDANRGKTAPANAREGSLLILRALCQFVGKAAEPYVVGAFLAAALDECGSSSSALRQAAEDTAMAIVKLANPWSFKAIVCPLLIQSLRAPEWRVKFNALERLQQCATMSEQSSTQVNRLLPSLIPEVTGQVWDTKAQVSKAAGATLLAICKTCPNPDVLPSIPAVVTAICKPSETNHAVQELMGTTFVIPVDAPTLAILCPVLARALKEKLAINKRAACIVISNMSKLVDNPKAVAPFGPLLVPELQKVSQNVQFEEIRDEALKALANLTKALGDSFVSSDDADQAQKMAGELTQVEQEQKRIADEKEAERQRQEKLKEKEIEERRKFREAMEAQRELDILAAKEAEQKRQEDLRRIAKEQRSTKTAKGKCQQCGLKKCPKSCLFYDAK